MAKMFNREARSLSNIVGGYKFPPAKQVPFHNMGMWQNRMIPKLVVFLAVSL